MLSTNDTKEGGIAPANISREPTHTGIASSDTTRSHVQKV
jgi:hypothetical protein